MSDEAHLVADRFILGEWLGSGGSAAVYAAHDLRTGRIVALKLLHAHLCERPAAREAFLAGARRAERLEHRNVAAVLEVGEDTVRGQTWISQERVDGSTLAARVSVDGPLPAADAIRVGIGVLHALEAVHAHGLIHRDVTPTNVMIEGRRPGPVSADDIRLLDFGLADRPGRPALGTDELLSARASGRAGILGNVNYVSPEHVRGEPIDARGDVYQTGALMYFVLTGRPPFPRDTPSETVRAHLDTPPPPASATSPGVPRALERIILRAMMKDPADRFASAPEMRRDLLALGENTASSTIVRALPLAPAALTTAQRSSEPPRITIAPAPHPRTAPSLAPLRGRPRVWVLATAMTVAAVALVAVLVTRTPTVSIADEPARTPSTAIAATVASAPAPVDTPASTAEPERRSVPELVRMTLSEAERALDDAGLAVGTITWVDAANVRDTVLQTRPTAGVAVALGEPVSLLVASGYQTVPDVRGMHREAAAAALQEAGFVPAFAEDEDQGESPDEGALGTDPSAGSVQPVGSTVLVREEVVQEPSPSPSPALPTPTATPMPTPAPTPTIDPAP